MDEVYGSHPRYAGYLQTDNSEIDIMAGLFIIILILAMIGAVIYMTKKENKISNVNKNDLSITHNINKRDTRFAQKLGMPIPLLKDCIEVYEEMYLWRKDEKEMEKISKGGQPTSRRLPKNQNAYKMYESYRNYLYDVEEWEKKDELGKTLMSFSNPYEKKQYEWIRDLKL